VHETACLDQRDRGAFGSRTAQGRVQGRPHTTHVGAMAAGATGSVRSDQFERAASMRRVVGRKVTRLGIDPCALTSESHREGAAVGQLRRQRIRSTR